MVLIFLQLLMLIWFEMKGVNEAREKLFNLLTCGMWTCEFFSKSTSRLQTAKVMDTIVLLKSFPFSYSIQLYWAVNLSMFAAAVV